MAKAKPGTEGKDSVNKSDEIRILLKANPKMPAKEVQDALAKRDIKVTSSLIYFIKGQIEGKKGSSAKPKQPSAKAGGSKPETSKSAEVRKIITANPTMSAKEIQDTLAKQSISVTSALIYFVKGKMKGTKQRKGAKAKSTATKASAPQVEEVNKSHEVRELLAQNRQMPAKEIQVLLARRGIKVSNNLIYLLKSKAGAKRRKQKREQVTKVASSNGHSDPVATIRKVKALASQVGGMKKLSALVEALSE